MSDKLASTAAKKHSGMKVLVAFAGMAMLFAPTGSAGAPAAETVHGLRQAGWVLVEKSERDEWRMGLSPYENMRRLVYVVTYTLKKEGRTMTCTLARDVMYDTFKQTCAPTR